MNRMLFAVGGIAAAVLILAGSSAYLGWFKTAPPAALPSAAPLVTVAPTTAATLAPLPTGGGALAIGEHYADLEGYRFTFDIPATGWASYPLHDWAVDVVWNYSSTEVNLWGQADSSLQTYHDPCHWSESSFTPGPSAADLASALAGSGGFTTTQPIDITVGPYSGKRLRITAPSNLSASGCDLGFYRSFADRYYTQPNETDDIAIVDVDGVREIFYASSYATTPITIKSQEDQIMQSVRITPIP